MSGRCAPADSGAVRSGPRMTASASAADAAVRLAVDCMGGDHGPSVTLPACRAFLDAHPQAELLLVGRLEALAPAAGWPRCTLIGATEVVEMHDPIEVALRRKKDSSMRVAVIAAQGRRLRPGRCRRLRLGRQHRRADGAGALPAQDHRRHRPPGDRLRDAEPARRLHDRARPRRQRRLHGRAPAAVRRHGQRAGRGGRGQRAAPASACSTSAKRPSRAARRSSRPANCCAAAPSAGC